MPVAAAQGVPAVVDGRVLTAAQAGDSSDWVEIARDGNSSLLVRANFINVYPNRVVNGSVVAGNPAWQVFAFGTNTDYTKSTLRKNINNWFNGTAAGEADKLPADARLRSFSVQPSALPMGTSTRDESLTNGFSRPSSNQVGTGDDVAFALSYGEAANFVSLLYFQRFLYIANQPSNAAAQANYAKINIPTARPYDGMWLRSTGDGANTVGFLSNSYSQTVPGRTFQDYLTGTGLAYPAMWVNSNVFVTAPLAVAEISLPGPSWGYASRATLNFFATDGSTPRMYCSLNGAPFVLCDTPNSQSYRDLAAGIQVFRVYPEGNPAGVDEYEWAVYPPDVVFTEIPMDSGNTSARFQFVPVTGVDVPVTFWCSLDGAAYTVCTSPRELSNLAPGLHNFQVYAQSVVGIGMPTSHTWQVAPGGGGGSPAPLATPMSLGLRTDDATGNGCSAAAGMPLSFLALAGWALARRRKT